MKLFVCILYRINLELSIPSRGWTFNICTCAECQIWSVVEYLNMAVVIIISGKKQSTFSEKRIK